MCCYSGTPIHWSDVLPCRDEQTEPSDVINYFHTGQLASLFPLCHFLKYTQHSNFGSVSRSPDCTFIQVVVAIFLSFFVHSLCCAFASVWLRVPAFYTTRCPRVTTHLVHFAGLRFLRVVEHLELRSNGPVASVCTLGRQNARVWSGESTLR